MTADASNVRASIIAAARQEFSFLEASGASFELDDRGESSVLAFIGEPIFELELDWRERAVFLLVCRPFDGHRPPGYYAHQGQRVRVHLLQALIEMGVGDQEARSRPRSIVRASGEEAMRFQISTLAATLAGHLDELNARIDTLFE